MKSTVALSKKNIKRVGQGSKLVKQKKTINAAHIVIWISLIVFAVDSIYRLINNINYSNKDACFFFHSAPKPVFLFYENFVELWLVMIFGIVCAVLLSRYFAKLGRFYPRGPISAFLYGSLMPICSCSTIPLLTTLKGKLKFRTIITFIMAAPLLSPIIIFLSFSVLGVKYGILRIVCSFVLAVGAGYFVELFYKPAEDEIAVGAAAKCDKNCATIGGGIFDQTWSHAKKLLPYILIAGALATIFSIFENDFVKYLNHGMDSWYGTILAVVIGIPIYVCNGADVFLLRPLLSSGMGLPYGASIAFSLSSSAICVASIILLGKVLGKKLTAILAAFTAAVCLIFGFIL